MEAVDYRKARRNIVVVLSMFVLSMTDVFDPNSGEMFRYLPISAEAHHIRWAIFMIMSYQIYNLYVASSFIEDLGSRGFSGFRLRADFVFIIAASVVAMVYYMVVFEDGGEKRVFDSPFDYLLCYLPLVGSMAAIAVHAFLRRKSARKYLNDEEEYVISEFLQSHQWEMVRNSGEAIPVLFSYNGRIKGEGIFQFTRWEVDGRELRLYKGQEQLGVFEYSEGERAFTLKSGGGCKCNPSGLKHIQLAQRAGRATSCSFAAT